MNYAGLIVKCDKCGGGVPGWQIGQQFIGGWCTNCNKWVPFLSPDEKPKLADVRPVLQVFARTMNERLSQETTSYTDCIERSEQELTANLLGSIAALVSYLDDEESPTLIMKAAADAANSLMILSDPERLRNR